MNNSVLVQFITENKESIYRLAYSYTHSKEDSLDIVQEAIYKAMKTKSSLKDPNAIKSWFYRIVVHTALDLLRKRKKLQPMEDEQLHSMLQEAEDAYPDVDLKQTLQQLPEKYRNVIILKYFEDLTIEQAAHVLNENVSTVKSRLYQALQLLKASIDHSTLGGER